MPDNTLTLPCDTQPPALVSIASVELDTGLPKDTLRVWERRYGFPKPLRNTFGERAYPVEQVARLRLVQRLLQTGQRPRHIVPMELAELQALLQDTEPLAVPIKPASHGEWNELQACMQLLGQHDMHGLRQTLNQASMQRGLRACVQEVIGPLTTLVGEAWMRGDIHVYEEHLYTECVTTFLRRALGAVARDVKKSTPRILLTTLPTEPHGLGLLMAETLFALEACDCTSLGVQTPLADIVRAAESQGSDIVALSFSACLKPTHVLNTLEQLRGQLPDSVGIWVGGSNPALSHIGLDSLLVVQRLQDIPTCLALWRGSHGSSGSAALPRT